MTNSEYLTKNYTLTVDEVAKILHYNIQYIRILARGGKIPAIKRGRKWLFCEDEIWEFLREHTESEITGFLKEVTKLKNYKSKERHGKRSGKKRNIFL